MKNAGAILELIGELVRERDQLREALGTAKRDLQALQVERDELAVKVRRLEAERPTAPAPSGPGTAPTTG